MLGRGSLLDGIAPAAPESAAGQVAAAARLAAEHAAKTARREARNARVRAVMGSKRVKRGVLALACLVLIGGAVGGWMYAHREPPDYDIDGLDSVFDYTLLEDDFNNLPVKQRLELIGKLVARLKNMNSGDSVLLAAFAAGIAGSAREQIEKNASRVMLDMTDQYATKYESLEGEAKDKYLEEAMVDMFRTMDALDGTPSAKTDEQILADAKRDSQRMKDFSGKLDAEQRGQRSERMFSFMRNGIGGHSSPAQRARITGFMRDAGRMIRGENAK